MPGYTTTITLQDWESGIPSSWTNYDGTWTATNSRAAVGTGSVYAGSTQRLYYNASTDGNGGTCQVSGYVRFVPGTADYRFMGCLVPGGDGTSTPTATNINNAEAGGNYYCLTLTTSSNGSQNYVRIERRSGDAVGANFFAQLAPSILVPDVWYYWQFARSGQVLTGYVQDTTTGRWLTAANAWSSGTAKVACCTVTDGAATGTFNPATSSLAMIRSTGGTYVDYVSFEAGVGATPLPATVPAVGAAGAGAGGPGLWTNPDVWAPAGSGYYPCKPFAVAGATAGGSGRVRLTVAGHPFVTGDLAYVSGVGGVTGASGRFALTVLDANTVELQGSTFGGAYTSGGSVSRADAVSIGPNADVSTPDGSAYAVGAGGGTALAVFGSLTLGRGAASAAGAGGTLTLRGDATIAAGRSLAVKRGGALRFDTAYGSFKLTISAGALLDCTDGTSGARIAVASVGGLAANNGALTGAPGAGGNGAGQVRAAFTDFGHLGTATSDAIRADCPASPGVALWGCTFGSCGQVTLFGDLDGCLSVRDSAWTGSLGAYGLFVDAQAAPGAGTREVVRSRFDAASKVCFSGVTGLTSDGNVFAGGLAATPVGSQPWASFDGNFWRLTGDGSYACGSMTNGFVYYDAPSGSNPHFLQWPSLATPSQTISGNAFYFNGADATGNILLFDDPNASPGQAVAVRNNLFLPNAAGNTSGAAITSTSNLANPYLLTIEHNTIHVGHQWGLEVGHQQYAADARFASIRANLFYGSGGSAFKAVAPDPGSAAPFADLACNNSTTVTSASGAFAGFAVGSAVAITGGSHFVPGVYGVVAAASAGSVTFDRNPTDGNAATGGTGKMPAVPQDVISPAAIGHNAGYLITATTPNNPDLLGNQGNGYASKFSSVPGATDIGLDGSGGPRFADPSATLAAWDATLGGPGTEASALANLLAGAAGYTNAALLAYLRAAYRPTNAALAGATYPGDPATADAAGNPLGGTIGAMAYLAAAASAPPVGCVGEDGPSAGWLEA